MRNRTSYLTRREIHKTHDELSWCTAEQFTQRSGWLRIRIGDPAAQATHSGPIDGLTAEDFACDCEDDDSRPRLIDGPLQRARPTRQRVVHRQGDSATAAARCCAEAFSAYERVLRRGFDDSCKTMT